MTPLERAVLALGRDDREKVRGTLHALHLLAEDEPRVADVFAKLVHLLDGVEAQIGYVGHRVDEVWPMPELEGRNDGR